MRKIVEYWRATELFGPPAIPEVPEPGEPPARSSERVYAATVRNGHEFPLLPWQDRHPHQLETLDSDRIVWQHTVYGGVFELDKIRQALVAQFGGDDPDYGGTRRPTSTAMFAFTVDDRGVLLGGTVVFSSSAWATGRIPGPGLGTPGWLDGFDDASEERAEAITLLTRRDVVYAADRPAAPAVSAAVGPGAWPTHLGAPPVPASVQSARATGNWKSLLAEVLGGAAVGAIGALLGDMGAGVIAGAAAPVVRA